MCNRHTSEPWPFVCCSKWRCVRTYYSAHNTGGVVAHSVSAWQQSRRCAQNHLAPFLRSILLTKVGPGTWAMADNRKRKGLRTPTSRWISAQLLSGRAWASPTWYDKTFVLPVYICIYAYKMHVWYVRHSVNCIRLNWVTYMKYCHSVNLWVWYDTTRILFSLDTKFKTRAMNSHNKDEQTTHGPVQ